MSEQANATLGGQPEFTPIMKAQIEAWLQAKTAAVSAVDLERDNRSRLTQMAFPNPTKGTQRYTLANGYALKLVYGWSYTLGDKEKAGDNGIKIPVRTQVADLQDYIESIGPEAKLISDRLIKWTPELVEKEYLELAASQNPLHVKIHAMVTEILTIKPKTPALEFEEPKAK